MTTKEFPLVYDVEDHTGEETRHLAVNKDAAVQAHMIHFGLLRLEKEPKVSEGRQLSEFSGERHTICWELCCCLAAMADHSE